MAKSGIYTLSHTKLDDNTGLNNPSFTADEPAKDGDEVKISEVHFQNNVPVPQSDKPYRGMGKDELLKHSSKGIWKTLRYIFMAIVFLGWLALIVAVIALVIVYPRCRKPENQIWWQTKTTYRVYVRSFQDSDNDGVGDFNGLKSRLNYLSEIGVGAISLSPVYQSSGKDSDFDITDHKAINPEYGTMDDFISLVNATHDKGMYLIMDFIPGFTSDQHEWFKKSQSNSNKDNPMKTYYVWEDGAAAGVPPSNWKSIYNGPAWKMDTNRNQYYLHQREATQPDLNLRSAGVNMQLMDIMKFWLDLGVDGFYIRESGWLVEDYDLRDESKSNSTTSTDPNAYDYYDHIYTYARPENNDIFARWRHFLDGYGNTTGSYKMLFADVNGDVDVNMKYYGLYNRDGVEFPLNKHIQALNKDSNSQTIYSTIKTWIDNIPTGRWSNWMGGDEYTGRFPLRREKLSRPLLFLTMLLPGTPFVYYGDEIGMMDSTNSPPNAWSREQVMRAPMQWDNSSMFGFCESCTPWLPITANLNSSTVQALTNDKNSMLTLFKNLTTVRTNPSFQYGDFKLFPLEGTIISFIKEFDGENGYLVTVNVGSEKATRDLSGLHETLPDSTSIVLTTKTNGINDEEGDLSTSSIELDPYEGLVSMWKYVAKEL